MTLFPNNDDKTAFTCQFSSRFLCFPHMRTSGIDDVQFPLPGLLVESGPHTVGTEYDCIASRELRQLLLAFYTLLFQFFYNTGIMNQFTQSGNTIIIPFCLHFCNVYCSFTP